jgi:glycosyltransferase involved in cell wall biosynthesis
LNRKKILILSALHLCRNPRVVKEATTLGAAGYDVTVMTVSASVRFAAIDRDLAANLPFRCVTFDLAGRSTAKRIQSILSRGTTWLARAALKHFRLESPRALGPAHGLLRMARQFRADLTIVHTEIPIWATRSLIRSGQRVAVDIEDWYSEDLLYADRVSRPLRLLRSAENYALNNAVYASATSESMAAALAESYGCVPPIVIHNTFPLQPRTRLDRAENAGPPSFVWFSQTVGPGRGLELFFSAWTQMRQPSRVSLIGDVRGNFRQQLLDQIPAERRTDVSFLPLVPPASLPDTLCAFDIGLALEPHWPRNKFVTTSNKIFHYLAAGLAVVATDTAGQAEVMREAPEAGLLVAAHETSELAERLDNLVADRAALRDCQRAARAAATAKFSWEIDAPKLLMAVDRALSASIK